MTGYATRTVCRKAAFDKGLCDALEVARLDAYNHGWVGAHLSNLSKDEAIELGSKVAALIGLGLDGEEGMEIGAEVGAEQAAEEGVEVPDEQAWDVLGDVPNDSAAALLLREHHWAVPLRDAFTRAGIACST